jgi:hypothetical protein
MPCVRMRRACTRGCGGYRHSLRREWARRCPHLNRDWSSRLPHLHQDWAHPCPHLHRDWAHPCPHLHRDWAYWVLMETPYRSSATPATKVVSCVAAALRLLSF